MHRLFVTSGIKLLPYSNATCQGGGEDRLERVALSLPNPSVDGAVSAGAVINLSPWRRGVATGISTDVPALCTWALQPCRRWMGSSKMLTPWNPSQRRRSNPTCGGPLCAHWCLVGKEESAHRHPRGGGSLHSCRGGEGVSGSLVPTQRRRRRRRRIRGRQHGRWRGEVGETKGDDTKEGKGTGQNVIDSGRSGTRMRPGKVSARVGPAGMHGWVTQIIRFW
jgi:hypothetical protein